MIAAYLGDELAGVLLADMRGEKKRHRTIGQTIYVKIFMFLQNTFYKGGTSIYDAANRDVGRIFREESA